MRLYSFLSVCMVFLFFLPVLISQVSACKDIMACGNATAGEYNLLLKVRDPSRPGFQVLCLIPENYSYTYHHPWTGKQWNFTTQRKQIGVTSLEDVPPNIVKAGMVLSNAGIAYGDADSRSRWVNPTKYAWDDFDWIRYASQQAITTDQALDLLTKDAVDYLHATGVSENLFVVGPEDGYLIEADAVQYTIKHLSDGVDAISNYPRDLWKTQLLRYLPKAVSFDSETNQTVSIGDTIRLSSLYGLKIVDINPHSISARQVPFYSFFTYVDGKRTLITEPIQINLKQRTTVGDYSIILQNITQNRATIFVQTVEKAWQETLLGIVNQKYGAITIKDMMNWSRLQRSDMNGLRPLCEPQFLYEGVAIYSLPKDHYHMLSSGWFSPSHTYASIFVPFHICNTDIADMYEDGRAAMMAQNISLTYQGSLRYVIETVENVFLYETNRIEKWAKNRIETVGAISEVVTLSDCSMQQQAWTMYQLLQKIGSIEEIEQREIIFSLTSQIFNNNFLHSIDSMKQVVKTVSLMNISKNITTSIIEIGTSIAENRLTSCQILKYNSTNAEFALKKAYSFFESEEYDLGFDRLKTCIFLCESLLFNE